MDNRAHPRRPAVLSVTYGSPHALRADYAHNISRGGLFLETDAALAPGDTVELQLSLAGAGGAITLTATVRWVGTLGEPPVRGVGVEFQRDDAALGARIDRLVARLDEAPNAPVRLLVVDPNTHATQLFSDGLRSEARRIFGDTHPLSVVVAHTAEAALEALRTELFDLAIIELRTTPPEAESLIAQVRRRLEPGLPIVAVARPDTGEERAQALAAGADSFLPKPVQLRTLVNSIRLYLA